MVTYSSSLENAVNCCGFTGTLMMGKNYDGDNVLSLPNGAGYLYLRQAFFQVLDFIDTLAPHIILSGHIKDKQVDDKGEMVLAANIDLTGKIKSLICANADAIG